MKINIRYNERMRRSRNTLAIESNVELLDLHCARLLLESRILMYAKVAMAATANAAVAFSVDDMIFLV